jgi:type IV pilus assembly protein PilW
MLVTRNRGFTLIELMVTLVLALVVLGGVMGVFISTYRANSQNIKAIRLNEEMRAVMVLMSRDVRRAGVRSFNWSATNVNWFSTYVFAAKPPNWVISQYTAMPANSCVRFTYDANNDNILDDRDRFGYRLGTNASGQRVVQTYNHVANEWKCLSSSATAWQPVTDPQIAWIQTLQFTQTLEYPFTRAPTASDMPVRTVVVNLQAATNTRSTAPSSANPSCTNVDVVCRQLVEKIRIRNDAIP